jgi:hypothetical protein
MIFLTTTAIEIDEELLNRCLVLSVDEDREQTRAIHRLQRSKRTLAGLQARQEKARLITLHQNAQRLLRSLAVVNPYADQLTFLDDRTRTRRDQIAVRSFNQETRALGITNYIDEMIAANPDRGITYEKIDSGLDLAVVADRVGAYLSANPNTNAYFDTGFWHAGVAGVLRDRGVPPGQVLLAGFDLVPIVLDEMEAGYIQVQVDQQPFMQGFMPVMMVHQAVNVGLAPVDMNTGEALVYPDDVPAIRELSEQGLR